MRGERDARRGGCGGSWMRGEPDAHRARGAVSAPSPVGESLEADSAFTPDVWRLQPGASGEQDDKQEFDRREGRNVTCYEPNDQAEQGQARLAGGWRLCDGAG